MSFVQRFSKLFGIIKVKTINNQIRITGLDGFILQQFLAKLFETNAVNKMMFTSVTDTAITFHQFFVPDFLFMIAELRHDKMCSWAGKRMIDKIVDGIMKNTWYKITTEPIVPMVDPERMKMLKWKPMPKQAEFLTLYGDKLPQYDLRGYILALAPGLGKAQPLDALVRTSEGWTRMGDVTLDTKAVMPDGTLAPVIAIYPQGVKNIYRVHFQDGRSTECCDEHLWKISNGYKRDRTTGKRGVWETVTTKDLSDHYAFHPRENRLYVPLISPENVPDVDLPINPYILGIILGDGYVGEKTVRITTADPFIAEEVSSLLPNDLELRHRSLIEYAIVRKSTTETQMNSFVHSVINLGLMDLRSYQKHIPNQYMNGSITQKLSLIQGLMDSDGTVDAGEGDVGGSPSFTTTSEVMAKQIQELIRSLGGLATISSRYPWYTYNDEKKMGRKAYTVRIRMADPKVLFRLPRKVERAPINYQYGPGLKLRIMSVEYIGKKEAQCISVDHPDHLYITDDYIVTHNTFSALLVACCVIPPEIAEIKIIISPKKAVHLVWEKTIAQVFKKKPTSWVTGSGIKMPLDNTEYYVFNYEQLDQAIMLGKHLAAHGKRYFVVVDESHNFADYRSNRTQKLVDLQTVKDDVYFLWLSGSPILKHAAELTSFLKCADPRFDSEAERRFRRIYSSSPGRAAEIFHHRLGQMMAFIVGKPEDTMGKLTVKELPVRLPPYLSKQFLMSSVREEMREFIKQRLIFYSTKIDEYRRFTNKWLDYHETKLTSRAEKQSFIEYQKNLKILARAPDLMMPDIMAQAKSYERTKLFPSLPPSERKAFRNALSAVKNIKLKVRGEALGIVLAKRRSECAAALAQYCQPEIIIKESLSKTMFFASSVLPVKTLEKKLLSMGFEPMIIYAGTNSNLTKNIESFTNDPNINPIIATMQSLSEAVPVVAASTLVLLNRPYRPANWQQVVSRADRLGQKYPVTVIEITLDTGDEPNVSSTTDDILASIREIINVLIGPEFAGPDVNERQYLELIDASKQETVVLYEDEKINL